MAGEDARKTRAQSRARRRKDAADSSPPPEVEAVQEETAQEDGDSLGAVKQAAKVAAVGAAVGAATAAARALTHHDKEGEHEEPSADGSSDKPDEGAREEEQTPVAEEPQEEREEAEPEEQDAGDEKREEREAPEAEDPPEPVQGAGPGETQEAVREAREQLQSLLGKPAESVSSLERTQDGWLIAFEVVELERVPDTTDVLASYEVELDENRGLRRYARVRRYARSQASGEER